MSTGPILEPQERYSDSPNGSHGVGSTSLVLIPGNGRQTRCPRRTSFLLNEDTGEKVPTRCDSYKCEFCGPWRVREWSWLLAWALPQRFVTLTLAGDDPERRRARVRDFRYDIRRAGYRWEDAWSTHVNPNGTGNHVHMVQHGDYVPQKLLSAIADGAGLGYVADIRKLTEGSRTAAYVLKEGVQAMAAAGYSMSEALKHDKRPVHMSRGFLRGAKVAEARKAVRELRWGSQDGSWRLVDESNRPIFESVAEKAARRMLGIGGAEADAVTGRSDDSGHEI